MDFSNPEYLETDRLILRRFAKSDLPRYAQIRSNPRVARFLSGGEGSAKEPDRVARQVFEQHQRLWKSNGYGPWVAVDRVSRNLIGHGGLRGTAESDAAELVYAVDEPWWGRGIATEIAKTSLDFGFSALAIERVIALAEPENLATKRVFDKAGLSFDRLDQAFGLTIEFFEITRKQWAER